MFNVLGNFQGPTSHVHRSVGEPLRSVLVFKEYTRKVKLYQSIAFSPSLRIPRKMDYVSLKFTCHCAKPVQCYQT